MHYFKKSYTVDFLTKKRVENNGQVPQYYIENNHEAIIPKYIFMQVQEELARRKKGHVSSSGKKRNFSSNHTFAQQVFCAECGEIYRRVHWNNRGKKSVVWRCASRLENTGFACHSRTVNEINLFADVNKAINKLFGNKAEYLKKLEHNINNVIVGEDRNDIAEIDSRLLELQQRLVKLATDKENYNDVAEEIYKVREEKQKALSENAQIRGERDRLLEIKEFIMHNNGDIVVYDEKLINKLVERILVKEEELVLEFKSE